MRADAGILILAGGMATRLPGKLMLDAGGMPLLTRVYRNLTGDGAHREIVAACDAVNALRCAAMLPVPCVLDRFARTGPLGGILSGFSAMGSSRVFVAAGDAPYVDGFFIERLASAWQHGDECVVPRRRRSAASNAAETVLEPLAALYDRAAVLREGKAVLRGGDGAVVTVIARLRARLLDGIGPANFFNINTAADYAALRRASGVCASR